MPEVPGWQSANANVFWRDIARFDHIIQIYESEGVLLDALTGFVFSAIECDEAAVIIATDAHLNKLEDRMETYDLNVEKLIASKKFIPLNAEEVLAEFMVNNMPDKVLFKKVLSTLFTTASSNNKKKIMAFGEMAALLWKKGNEKAAIELEHLWSDMSRHDSFSLFCAYPKSAFNPDEKNSEPVVCSTYTKMICGKTKQLTHIYYKQL